MPIEIENLKDGMDKLYKGFIWFTTRPEVLNYHSEDVENLIDVICEMHCLIKELEGDVESKAIFTEISGEKVKDELLVERKFLRRVQEMCNFKFKKC